MDTTTTKARQMTRSPVALAEEALRVARAALPAYGSKFSGKTYTQHQLFAILTLKQFFRTDYRGVVALLHDLSDLRAALGLARVPHPSTLCYAHGRLLKKSTSSG